MKNTISELLKTSIESHPDKNAVIDNGILTYRQLYHDAACLASALERSGAGRGDLIGIKLNRSKEYIVSIVSCLLFGYGAVLLDVEYPPERIEYIIKDSSAAIVVDGSFYEKAIADGITAAYAPVSPDTSALVVYTSGSTGSPKGVLHDQESVHDAMQRLFKLVDLKESDLYGSTAPYTFIAIGIDLLCHLCLGATVDVIPREVVKNAEALSDYIAKDGINGAYIPPKILKVFNKKGDSLRYVMTGSERVSGIAPDQFRIFNMYGMSEGFPSICAFDMDKAYDCTPIGKGDGSLGLYLLDENGNEASEGEICISGHLFSGYINLKEQTEKVLCPNPFREKDGHATIFHTNDIGRRLPDGSIMYVNRKDWMVKINGFRVEPGEIEYALKELSQIFDCAVKAFVRENGTPYLAAYYVEKSPVSVDELRDAMIRRFPYYMVPTYYTRLESLPVNANGKLDNRTLAEPETAGVAVNYAAPANEVEEALCKAMASVLCVKKVGIKDDFFALGGSYEEAVCLIKKLPEYEFTEKQIYKYKTPEKICMALMHEKDSGIDAENRLALSVPQPLTRAQQYYLDYQLYAPKEKIVNNGFSISIPVSNIDITDLKNLLELNFTKHPALSSKIVFGNDGELVLKYNRGKIVPVECYSCTEDEFEKKIKNKWMRTLPSFNSLLYYCLIYTTETQHHILFDIHRSICDSSGILNLFRGLSKTWNGQELPADYYYVYLSRMDLKKKKYLGIDVIKNIQAFLDDDTISLSPVKDIQSRIVTKETYCIKASKDADAYAQAAEAHRTPVEQLLIASALLATGRYNKTESVAVNWLYSGRDEKWKKDAVGQMSAAIPIGAKLTDYTSLIDLLSAIKTQCNFGIEYSDTLTFLGSNPGMKDLLQVEYLDRSMFSVDSISSVDAEVEEYNHNSDQLHLSAVHDDADNSIIFLIQYNSACYKAESISRFAALFSKAFDLCCFGTLKEW